MIKDKNKPIEHRCMKCGKVLVVSYYDKSSDAWVGNPVRHMKRGTDLFLCRDCDEPPIGANYTASSPLLSNQKG